MKKRLVFEIIFIVASVFCAGGDAWADKDRISIMTFNVENLFDARHDSGKYDYTYLPKELKNTRKHKEYCDTLKSPKWRRECMELDWTEQAVDSKCRNVAGTILKAGEGNPPDLVVLDEVENLAVLSRLNRALPKGKRYPLLILIEGRDARGIDIAFMTKLELVSGPKLHNIRFRGASEDRKKDTRGILEAVFKLPDGTEMTVFGVHMPAPFHPTKMRRQALNYLNRLKLSLPKGTPVIAAGDFNITAEEDRTKKLTDRYLRAHWIVANDFLPSFVKGTHYYAPKKSWSFLDKILLSKYFETGKWRLDKNSVRVVSTFEGQIDDKGHPVSFDPASGRGVSDHLPLYIEIMKAETK